MSSFQGMAETIARNELFRAFYTDRGSHYLHTKAGGKVDKSKPTQVGRALSQLGITHIPSYSPEARGRMERAFGTIQSRLPPELRLAEIATAEAVNRQVGRDDCVNWNAISLQYTAAAPSPSLRPRQRAGCTNIRTGGSPSSPARAFWRASTRPASRSLFATAA